MTLLQQLTELVGRRADDPDLVAFVTGALGKKVPDTTTDAGAAKNVVAKKCGLELAFSHNIRNERYPLIAKRKNAFVPYLSLAWLTDKFPEPLPFGLARGMAPEEVTKALGVEPVPRGFGARRRDCWTRPLDAARGVVFAVDGTYSVSVQQARALSTHFAVPPPPVTGLFLAWAARRGLIDAGRHAPLLAEVRAGTRKGSEFLLTAWPRGLWDEHLFDRPGLRDFTYCWFHNIGVGYIRDDLVGVFGGRPGAGGHQEPALDDDTAEAVSKAAPVLDSRFAAWVG